MTSLAAYIGLATNVNDVTQAAGLLHVQETDLFADAGYQGVAMREKLRDCEVRWQVAMRPGKRRAPNTQNPAEQLLERVEQLKASVRAKVEHPFRLIKQESAMPRCAIGA